MNNKELKAMSTTIVEKQLEFRKGTVSGHSIEITESDPESHTSFIYYEDEEKRDSDFEELMSLSLGIISQTSY
jgi:hypothetical protein